MGSIKTERLITLPPFPQFRVEVLGIDPTQRWAQLALAKAIDGLPLDEEERVLYETHTGRSYIQDLIIRQVLIIVGRQSGKTEEAADRLVYEGVGASLAGERGISCIGVAQDQRSATGALFGYVQRRFENPMLSPLVIAQTNDTITLVNDVQITVLPCRPAALRGRRCRIVVLDEIAHFRNSENIALDKEVWRAALPTLLTTGGRLFALSSPYNASGLLYDLHQRHYGKADSSTLVWRSAGTVLHPTLDAEFMQQLRDGDPEGARAELDAEFLSNVSALIDEESLCAAIDPDVRSRPPQAGCRYHAFVDVATGTKANGDLAALGIAHSENNRAILDTVIAWRPPFSPQSVASEMSEILRTYGLRHVTGDRFAQGFTSDAFSRVGIQYRPSEADKSALYLQMAGAINSGTARLTDDAALHRELRGLERRRGPTKDRVDHRRGANDDRANVCAGALCLAATPRFVGAVCANIPWL